MFSARRQTSGYFNHENGAGHCLQPVARLDEYRPRASAGAQRGVRGPALLSLRQAFQLLHGQKHFAGIASRFGRSGFFSSESIFSAGSGSGGLGVARRRRARAFCFTFPAVDDGRRSAFRAELRPAYLIFPS
jgi:hypothetical protein